MEINATKDRDVWLVKVPKSTATSWLKAKEGTELGKLHVSKSQPHSMRFVLSGDKESSDQNSEATGQEFTINLRPSDQQNLVIISQDPPPANIPISNSKSSYSSASTSTVSNPHEKISLEGHVRMRGELKTNLDKSYLERKSIYIKDFHKPARMAQILDKAVTNYKPRSSAQLDLAAQQRKKREEAKKSYIREDKDVVQNRIFSAFEKQQFYSLKDLGRVTGQQSISYLKDIVKEICNYCTKAPNKAVWELKPEYRHKKPTQPDDGVV